MIKTFKMFREKVNMNRKYVCIVYDDESQQNLRNWCQENGFDITKSYSGNDKSPEDFEFHTTIFYSINKSNIENEVLPLTQGEALPSRFKLLGDNNDIPVLVVSSPNISEIRDDFVERGLLDQWPDYVPHISLSYVRKDYDFSGIKLPDFRMKFGYLKIEDISEKI